VIDVLMRCRRSERAIAPWTAAWLGGAVIGIANGVAREATYGKC
jgi:hypothetical protein